MHLNSVLSAAFANFVCDCDCCHCDSGCEMLQICESAQPISWGVGTLDVVNIVDASWSGKWHHAEEGQAVQE